jgi:hypothetical protein
MPLNHPFTFLLLALLCCLIISRRWWRKGSKQNTAGSARDMGWMRPTGAKVAVSNKAKEEWDIREATFLYQTRGLGADPCYLEATCADQGKVTRSASFKSDAPSAASLPQVAMALPDDFMTRMVGAGRNARRSSECEATSQGVAHKVSGLVAGCIFTVRDIFWISPTDVEVSGGLCVGTKAGTSKTYYLKKVGGTWQIIGEHLKSISCG